MPINRVPGTLGVALFLLIGPLTATAADKPLAEYERWLAGQRVLNSCVTSETRLGGASPVGGAVTSRLTENVTRNGDEWVIQTSREDFEFSKRKLKPKRIVEFKVGPAGAVTVPRKASGEVDGNVIADSKAGPGQIGEFLSIEAAFLFGYLNNDLTFLQSFGRGDLTNTPVSFAGRAAVEVRSSGKWGRSSITLDPARGYAPLRAYQRVESGDLIASERTLGQRPASRSPFYLPELVKSVETVFEVSEFTSGEPVRIKKWNRITTTSYVTGKAVVSTSQATAMYPDAPATAPSVAEAPPGTPAILDGESSGVEYQWDGRRAVAAHDPTVTERLRGVEFSNPWLLPALLAATAIGGVVFGFYKLRRGMLNP